MTQPSSPFDPLATEYEHQFDGSLIGGLLRQAVWRRLEARFHAGDHLLEINCGTGRDAIWLAQRRVRVLATDSSPAMLEAARRNVREVGAASLVEVRCLSIEDIAGGAIAEVGPFDGLLSNFGGLNCVQDLAAVGAGLARQVRSGGYAVLCVMGPAVPWEWAWFLLRGKPATAFRRFRRAGVTWRGMTIKYPSIRTLRRAWSPGFHLERVAALGALLPPTYVEMWARKYPEFVRRLAGIERRIETAPLLPWLADHYLLEMERV